MDSKYNVGNTVLIAARITGITVEESGELYYRLDTPIRKDLMFNQVDVIEERNIYGLLNDDVKAKASAMRRSGYTIAEISDALGLGESAIRAMQDREDRGEV